MERAVRTLAIPLIVFLAARLAVPADAGKAKKRSGIKGVVLSRTCAGPCIDPPPPQQPYAGEVTVTVHRVADGALVASSKPTDGRFRFRTKRGLYDVTAELHVQNVCVA